MADAVATLKHEKYVSLETYRKDGTPVRVPVWIVELDGRLTAWTDAKSFKVKRLRNNSKARLAACDMRGNVRGEWLDFAVEIIDGRDGFARVDALIVKKYGWQRSLIVGMNRLGGRWPGFVGIAFSPV